MADNHNDTPDAAEPDSRRRKISIKTKLLFAFGSLQEATVGAADIVTVIFYNQILGVSPAMCGLAYLIVQVTDAITDPVVGTLSDQFNSRWGRRHPFMFASILPVVIAFYFLYQPIDGLGETGYFIWLVVFLMLVRIGQTLYVIPHDALGAELTDDHDERSSVFGYHSVVQTIFHTVTAIIVYTLIFPSTPEYENGLLNEGRYIILAAVGSVTIIFAILVCAFGTLDQVPYLHRTDTAKKFNLKAYLKELGVLIRNRSYISACLSLLTIWASFGILGICATYAYVYAYELSTEQMTWAGIVKIPGALTALPLLYFLSKRMEKKQIVIWMTVISSTLVASPHFFKLAGIFPPNDSPLVLIPLFGTLLLGFMVFPVTPIIIDSQLADIADEHEYHTGKRSEGIIFSVRSFATKATRGVGGFIAGIALTLINFPDKAEVGNLPPETVTGLLVIMGPVYLGFYLLAAFFMTFYQIDKKRHAEILTELERRRSAQSSGGD